MAISAAKWEYPNTSATKINEFHVRWVEMHWVKMRYHTLQMCIAFCEIRFLYIIHPPAIFPLFSACIRAQFPIGKRSARKRDRALKSSKRQREKKKQITAVTTTKSTRYFFAPFFRVFSFTFEFSERDCCYWEKCIHANIQKQKLKFKKKRNNNVYTYT